MVLGTNNSIEGNEAFSPDQISAELQSILSADGSISYEINVVAEDIYMSKPITVGLGGNGSEYVWNHYSYSLTQYYYWPEGLDDRMANLRGEGEHDWDYVVIGADPYIASSLPGYYALGVNKIADKAAEGGAKILLLMMWSRASSDNGTIEQFEEFTYRTGDKARAEIETIPAGLAWNALPDDKKDEDFVQPTPNGAYLTAASIYSHITCQNASMSDYAYDDELADMALATVVSEANKAHYTGISSFVSPFKSCDISEDVINYNHTGTSSENGIKGGLNWVFNQAPETLQNGGTSPINFNYGRANTNFEPNKRYKINPELFDFSFGFPMQDHSNNGNTSMLYGLDRRSSFATNATDLGVAQYMISQSELPYARAIPIRTLYAQILEAMPGHSAYKDGWHMHQDLDKATGAFMYTMLTGNCALGEEPADQDSEDWKKWRSHKVGIETAWTLMYMEGEAPICGELVDLDGDGFNSFFDCDDDNAEVNPDQLEIPYNGLDDDCNEFTLDDDLDQDGFLLADDCDDTDSAINPDQMEIAYNGLDDDCDVTTLDDDLDQDGFVLAEDCDDNDNAINPDELEIPYNGLDDDCNDITFDDDLDQDGFLLAEDCDDNDDEINPDVLEIPYNGIDEDCNPETFDDDLDQDGFLLADDCDDDNADINPDAEDIPNNGIDEDCDGSDMITSVYELDNAVISIYPNPVFHFINIEVSGDLIYNTKLYDINGQLIMSGGNDSKLDIRNLSTGSYLLEIENQHSSQKIVKRIIKID